MGVFGWTCLRFTWCSISRAGSVAPGRVFIPSLSAGRIVWLTCSPHLATTLQKHPAVAMSVASSLLISALIIGQKEEALAWSAGLAASVLA